jgi:hypothetical protein
MAEPKDTTSFFRKVVKFVANPTTEWADVAPSEDVRETEFAKSELKAMIERKRRNDFVRKREFDMLRKVRREGLSSEQLAALGGSSRLDDSEGKLLGPESGAKQDAGVKAKIDEIEQQMVGDGLVAASTRRGPEFYNAPTQPIPMDQRAGVPTQAAPLAEAGGGRVSDSIQPSPRSAPAVPPAAVMGAGVSPLSPLSPLTLDSGAGDFANPFAVEVSEVAHDPELDEAVIAFANADFEQCEQALAALTGQGGARAAHAETWLVLFDLYRAIGQQHRFESLALDYAQQFGWSAPQWFSMPRLVAEAVSEERPTRRNSRIEGQVGWVCPEYLDTDAVAKLGSQSLQMPLPWVFDWSHLKGLDAEACARLSELFRSWIRQKLDMRWLGGERLFTVLQDAAPTGVRDADPAYWQLRLDALRMANRADQFDECAIDYCVTYEVSPPSWEPARCEVRISSGNLSTTSPPLSVVSEVSTSFVESKFADDPAGTTVEVAAVELSGQLIGDIGATLKKLEAELGASTIVNVTCGKLIRVDFIAAGDLLNWVLARRSENRSVSFVDAHRLVALFFGAMGINEHAKVKVRTV